MKQELAARYDYDLDTLYKEIDDWNYKFVDAANLKRFLVKCGIFPSDQLLLATIRRMDLDADAKLNMKEFIDGIRPLNNFSREKVEKKKTKPVMT